MKPWPQSSEPIPRPTPPKEFPCVPLFSLVSSLSYLLLSLPQTATDRLSVTKG